VTRRWLAVALLCVSTGPAIAQQPTFSSRRETVRVDVLVSDRGRPVRGLGPADFDVLDSGVRQEVDFVGFEQLPISVVLALDISRSILPAQLTDLRNASRAVIGQLKANDRAALLTFTHAVALRQELTSDGARTLAALEGMRPADGDESATALIDTSYTAMTMLDGEPGRALLIVFTDGVDTASWLEPERVLDSARRSNVVVYAVSAGRLPRGSFLRELAELTGGSAIEGQSAASVSSAFVQVLDEFRQRYLVSFSPANVPAGGWHPLTVRVKNRRADVRARAGYVREERAK
jgi:Ca-activated chloride channel family protein